MTKPFVVAGGIVRNRAWILPWHLAHVRSNLPALLYYLTGDNEDDTEEVLKLDGNDMNVPSFFSRHDTGFAGWRRDGEPRYSSEVMAGERNLWLKTAVERWPNLTHLWVVDSDVLPHLDCLEKLLAVDRPVVGAWVPGCTPTEGWDNGTGQARRTGAEGRRESTFRATMLGGCYLIRRDAIDAGVRWAAHPQGEDGGFGDSCRALGIDMWACPEARCGHVMTREGR